MQEFTIVLRKIGSVARFVEKMNHFRGSVMLIDSTHRINAKSLLGVMNMDKGKPVSLRFEDCDVTDLREIMDDIKSWAPDKEG